MAISVAKLAEYMGHGLNIYIVGKAGTGKTQMLKKAGEKAGLKVGYMSAPTLDAYIDLIGIPTVEEDKTLNAKVLKFIRKKDFLDIEALFIDELPRGELKTLNAIFELLLDGTINGERAIPNLKCVIAAGNPMTEEYTGQQQLDEALLDRMDIYLETDTAADLPYFIEVFGKQVGKALVDWHKLHDHEEKGYLSPRRLEKIGHTWLKMSEVSTLKAMVPPGGTFNVNLLQKSLEQAVRGEKIQKDTSAPISKRVPFMADKEIRDQRVEILAALPSLAPSELAQVTEAVSRALKNGVIVDKIVSEWGSALEYFSTADKTTMVASWPSSRVVEFQKKLASEKIAIGKNLITVPSS